MFILHLGQHAGAVVGERVIVRFPGSSEAFGSLSFFQKDACKVNQKLSVDRWCLSELCENELLFASMWPCNELTTCPRCHSALSQLGLASADSCYPGCSRSRRLLKMDGRVEGWMVFMKEQNAQGFQSVQ